MSSHRCLASLIGLLVALASVVAAAQDHARLVLDTREAVPLGPQRAVGAVVWNHAGEAPRQADPAPAVFVDLLRGQRYDVFRLERRPDGDTIAASTRALVAGAREVRARGYRRVVLAGQSAGAWIALATAAQAPALVDVVIATAPAAFGRVGEDRDRAQRNRDDLLRIAEQLGGARVMVFLFDGDEFDPGGRGPALAAQLQGRGTPHLVVDRPAGWRGHGVGLTRAFARRFGPCILAFVLATGDGVPACDRLPAAEIPYEFQEPVAGSRRAAANDNHGLREFVGVWRGSLDNGDDVQLVVEGGTPESVRAVFARGRSRADAADRAFSQVQLGRFDPMLGALVFDERHRLRIVARALGVDRLAVSVTNPDRRRSFSGELGRLERSAAAVGGLSP